MGHTEEHIVELVKDVFVGAGVLIVVVIWLAGVVDLPGLFRGRRSKNDR